MKNIFNPEDFRYGDSTIYFNGLHEEKAARLANEKLNKLIESWPMVDANKDFTGHFVATTRLMEDGSHTAYLAFIKENPKKQCKHTPYRLAQTKEEWRCATCGVELVAEWKEKK